MKQTTQEKNVDTTETLPKTTTKPFPSTYATRSSTFVSVNRTINASMELSATTGFISDRSLGNFTWKQHFTWTKNNTQRFRGTTTPKINTTVT